MKAAETTSSGSGAAAPAPPDEQEAVRIEPDLDFIRAVERRAGGTFKKCFQCGTCSATCPVTSVSEPFPRKEMAWAVWGLKDRLLTDLDVWLCHQCNDCSTRCPRGGRPGDVLAAVRQESVIHFAFPRFLACWAGQPQAIPLLLGIPAALLTLALLVRDPIANALGIQPIAGSEIVYSYSHAFPHWLLNSFFFFFTGVVILASAIGLRRFWRSLKAADPRGGVPVRPILPSFFTVLWAVFGHRDFTVCKASRPRLLSHLLVFYGFLALTVVTITVITARVNPLLPHDFVYPFSFLSPMKVLANVGGIAVTLGILLMIRQRLREVVQAGGSNYTDWTLLLTILLVIFTGFFTEVLHYVRLEPHRHAVYFLHLVFVFALLMYMPFSKLAHVIYRTAAMVYAEHTGRTRTAGKPVATPPREEKRDGERTGVLAGQ